MFKEGWSRSSFVLGRVNALTLQLFSIPRGVTEGRDTPGAWLCTGLCLQVDILLQQSFLWGWPQQSSSCVPAGLQAGLRAGCVPHPTRPLRTSGEIPMQNGWNMSKQPCAAGVSLPVLANLIPGVQVMGSFWAFGELLLNSCLHRSTSWGWRCLSRHPGGLKSQRNAQKSSSGDCPRVVPALKGVQRAGQVTGEKSHLCCCVSRSWDSDYFRHKWSWAFITIKSNFWIPHFSQLLGSRAGSKGQTPREALLPF